MVERKIRPTPLTLVARKSPRTTGKQGPATRLQLPSKLFVLDTNVLMHDPTSLFRFEEHDIYLPILTLEELDNNKKGVSEVARNARQASRFLDELVTAMPNGIVEGISLAEKSGGAATGKLYLQTEVITTVLPVLARERQGGQPDPRGRHAPAAPASEAARDPGQQGHQHADQGARAGDRRRGLLQRQGAGGHRAPLHGHARAAGRLLGPARQGDRIVAARRAHVLPALGAAGAVAAGQRIRLPRDRRRGAALRAGEGDLRQDRGAADAQGLHAPEEQRLGHHRAQPRAELRAQHPDEPRDRLRDAAGPGGQRQDAADARRRR